MYGLRRAGINPTEQEIQDMINQIDETDRGILDFPTFLMLIREKLAEVEDENQYKDAFRVFSKDNEGGLESRCEVAPQGAFLPGR